MENGRAIRRPWRSWTAITFVLMTLALAQACGDSGKSTGPTSNASLQLKLRGVNGAELPVGCLKGTFDVIGPGVNINNATLPSSGKISFQGQIGQTYTVSVEITCGLTQVTRQSHGESLSGSTQITLKSEGNEATIVLTASKVLSLSCKSPVGLNEASACTCQFQSPGPTSIDWKGANPTSFGNATFPGSGKEGSFPVVCIVNGVSSPTFNIQVQGATTVVATTGSIEVTNTFTGFLLRQRRVLAQGPGVFAARVVPTNPQGSPSGTKDVGPSQTVAFGNLPAGEYRIEYFCSSDLSEPNSTDDVIVQPPGKVSRSRNWNSLCNG